MLQLLQQLPADPILGISAACRADPNPHKVDLAVGIYMNEEGVCPVFEAVQLAQRALVDEEVTKAYLPAAGDEQFNLGIQRLVLGEASPALLEGRVSSIQTPGGCGALRIGAEIIHAAAPGARVWVSDPTWPVHIPLLGSVGLEFRSYRYYEPDSHGVNFDGMVEDLKQARAGDVVLLHGCCHNPSGADLTLAQWAVIADLAEQQGFTPFVDLAYQGLGDGLDEDAAGLRLLVSRLPEVIVAASCSKNLGLYRERTGAAIFVCRDAANARAILSQALAAARRRIFDAASARCVAGRACVDGRSPGRDLARRAAVHVRAHQRAAQQPAPRTGSALRWRLRVYRARERHVLLPRPDAPSRRSVCARSTACICSTPRASAWRASTPATSTTLRSRCAKVL